jgi:hypothetical protein
MRWSLGWPRSNISHGIPNRPFAADCGQRGEAAGAFAKEVARGWRNSMKVEEIHGRKGDNDSGETKPKHITNIVPSHALSSLHLG